MNLKFIYTNLLVLLTFSLPVISQEDFRIETDFNDDHSFIKIDTTNPDNIWQIGPPQKELFNEAYTPPNVIITDTINPYTPGNYSTFQFTVTSPDTGFCWSHSLLSIAHRFDTDTLRSGGYIEISYDSIEWHNIIFDEHPGLFTHSAYFYSHDDTISKGIPAFSGRNLWTNSQFRWERVDSIAKIDSILIRFNFLSDTIETQKEGWMIDQINIAVHDYCGIIVPEFNDTQIFVFPNPAINIINFDIHQSVLPCTIMLINSQSQIVKLVQDIKKKAFSLDCGDLSPGIYFYCIKSKRFIKKGTIIIN